MFERHVRKSVVAPRPAVATPTDEPNPLRAWRSNVRPGRDTLDEVRRLLDGPVTLHRAGWRQAVREDPVVAFGVAIGMHDADDLDGPAADVVMSELLLHEVAGNAAAALVLRHARAKAARTRTAS